MSEDFINNVFSQAEGMAILSSCTKGQTSYEWKAKERSVYTHFFLDALSGMADLDQKGFVTVNDVHNYVLNEVKIWAVQHTASQTPTLFSDGIGEIVITTTK
jgi:hypothetical protein